MRMQKGLFRTGHAQRRFRPGFTWARRRYKQLLKLYAHGMRLVRCLGACVWFCDVTSFSDASGMVCVRVEPVFMLTHQTHCSGFGKEWWCDHRHCFLLRWRKGWSTFTEQLLIVCCYLKHTRFAKDRFIIELSYTVELQSHSRLLTAVLFRPTWPVLLYLIGLQCLSQASSSLCDILCQLLYCRSF